ncbi:FecR family protein [Dyadobacter tibetensis]|uniref:FecR family protein n=1 Tax=Dyadobacter tibetensis TaxID=1211851 RepID=UPI00046F3433|nr:FecR domain-containing protein [Dyadobacter tibetensis]
MNIDDLYNSFGLDPSSEDGETENSLSQKKTKIKNRVDRTLGWSVESKARPLRRYLFTAAASIALFSILGLYWFLKGPVAHHTMLTVVVPPGTTRQVELPDGSRVWLNAASVLKYPAEFGENREVYLEEGEGFFQVKRDTTSPFTVRSQHLNTRVLGTSFRVKAYQKLSHEVVTVVSGKVSVSEGNKPLGILEKDQEISFSKHTLKALESRVKADDMVEWTSGQVTLKSVRFEDIILAIENVYQVNIHFEHQKFEGCESSIRFGTDQRLEDVLDLVRDIQGITYSISGKEVIISGKGCL